MTQLVRKWFTFVGCGSFLGMGYAGAQSRGFSVFAEALRGVKLSVGAHLGAH